MSMFKVSLLGLLSLLVSLGAHAQGMLSLPSDSKQSTTALPTTQTTTTASPQGEAGPHAVALRARWVTVPGWELAPYTDAHTQLNGGWSLGLEYLHRLEKFDIVVSLDYSWLNPDNGNYLGKGHDPSIDTHFLAFDRLSSLSADVSIIGHWNLTAWLEIRFGAGLGLGVVFGNIYQINSSPACNINNANDLTACHPVTVAPRAPYNTSTPYPDQTSPTVYCNPNLSDSSADTASNPCLRQVGTYPLSGRVVPVLNTLLGFRFKAHRNVYVHLETGWRLVGWYLGAGPEYRF